MLHCHRSGEVEAVLDYGLSGGSNMSVCVRVPVSGKGTARKRPTFHIPKQGTKRVCVFSLSVQRKLKRHQVLTEASPQTLSLLLAPVLGERGPGGLVAFCSWKVIQLLDVFKSEGPAFLLTAGSWTPKLSAPAA